MNARFGPLVGLFGIAVLVACSASSNKKSPETGQRAADISILVTADLRGTTEPCGCNSDPHGDLARTAAVLADLRASGRPTLYMDGGSTLYSELKPQPHLVAQEALKAKLLVNTLTAELGMAAIGLGPFDLAAGPGEVRPPRHAANLGADSGVALTPPSVIRVGDRAIGVFGVVSPSALSPFGIDATDPVAAAKAAISELSRQGAEVIICLAGMTVKEAAQLARDAPGIHFVVANQETPEPGEVRVRATAAGDAWVIAPANRGQVVSRLDLHLDADGATFTDAVGPSAAARMIAQLDERASTLERDLADWKAKPDADPEFVKAREAELGEIRTERAALASMPLRAPKTGRWFTLDQIAIRKNLRCDSKVQDAKIAYDNASGAANVEAAKGIEVVAPAAGEASYVGTEECAMCHGKEAAFWETTGHAGAWKTLVDVGKEFNYDCIGCHITGFDRPGGSNLAHNEDLRAVQCETCHGPGSIHVEAEGEESPSSMIRTPAESVCGQCHTKDHSDTFEFEAYLRDVTGPGHGGGFRKTLGDGPTGHSLRSAALEAAGKAIGTGCLK